MRQRHRRSPAAARSAPTAPRSRGRGAAAAGRCASPTPIRATMTTSSVTCSIAARFVLRVERQVVGQRREADQHADADQHHRCRDRPAAQQVRAARRPAAGSPPATRYTRSAVTGCTVTARERYPLSRFRCEGVCSAYSGACPPRRRSSTCPTPTTTARRSTSPSTQGRPLLIVNTASKCGFTPQYDGLQALHEQYADRGPGGARLPVRPVRPPGARRRRGDRGVLLAQLRRRRSRCPPRSTSTAPSRIRCSSGCKSQAGGLLGSRIKWNFTKFLVGRDGGTVTRYAPTVDPARSADDVEALVGA